MKLTPFHPPQDELTLLLNAGGQSTRMRGENKALLPIPPDGTPLARYQLRHLAPLTRSSLVIANDTSVCDVVSSLAEYCLPDSYPNSGPLGGLATGLKRIRGWCLCVACDMPFISHSVVHLLWRKVWGKAELERAEDGRQWDAVVPIVDGRLQPLLALYHDACLPSIQAQIASKQLKMTELLDRVRTCYVPEKEIRPADRNLRSFFNANTPEDWKQALRWFEQEV